MGFPMSELVLGEMVVIRFTPGTGGLAPEDWGGGRGGNGGGGRPEPVHKGEASVSRSSPRAAPPPPLQCCRHLVSPLSAQAGELELLWKPPDPSRCIFHQALGGGTSQGGEDEAEVDLLIICMLASLLGSRLSSCPHCQVAFLVTGICRILFLVRNTHLDHGPMSLPLQ